MSEQRNNHSTNIEFIKYNDEFLDKKNNTISMHNLNEITDDEQALLYKVKPYNTKAGIAMIINCIIGTGCFGLPYAFNESGFILGTLLILFGTFLAIIAANYVIETMARMEGITKSIEISNNNNNNNTKDLPYPNHMITYRKFDFVTISEFFGGFYMKLIVQISLYIYLTGICWAFGSVFGSSIASYLYPYLFTNNTTNSCDPSDPNASFECHLTFYLTILIYSIIMILFVLMNVGEQAKIQKLLTMYRFIALFIMFITMIMKIITDPSKDIQYNISNTPLFNISKFGKGFGPGVLAINCHFAMPDMFQPLKNKNKIQFVGLSALSISIILYIFIGIIGPISFGNDTKPLVTINWNDYTGCGKGGWTPCNLNVTNNRNKTNILGELIKAFILLFPAINVASTFPLVAVSLAENLYASLSNNFKNKYGSKLIIIGTRIISTFPPLIFCCLFKKIDLLFTFVGIIGVIITLSIPFWFQRAGIIYCKNKWDHNSSNQINNINKSYDTKYSFKNKLSDIKAANFFLLFSFVIVGIACALV